MSSFVVIVYNTSCKVDKQRHEKAGRKKQILENRRRERKKAANMIKKTEPPDKPEEGVFGGFVEGGGVGGVRPARH